jgi:hypothetical protein
MHGVAIQRTTMVTLVVLASCLLRSDELQASIVMSTPRGVSAGELRCLDAELSVAGLRMLGSGARRVARVAFPAAPREDAVHDLQSLLAECRAAQAGGSMDPSGQGRSGVSNSIMVQDAEALVVVPKTGGQRVPEEPCLHWDDADPLDLLRPPELRSATGSLNASVELT